jgi:hypothetical protein
MTQAKGEEKLWEKCLFKDEKEFATKVGAILADFAVSVNGQIANKIYFNEKLELTVDRILESAITKEELKERSK